jgi:hypothetical protein
MFDVFCLYSSFPLVLIPFLIISFIYYEQYDTRHINSTQVVRPSKNSGLKNPRFQYQKYQVRPMRIWDLIKNEFCLNAVPVFPSPV